MWNKLKEQFNHLKLEKKKLYLITNSDNFESKEVFLDAIVSALQGGVDIIRLEEPQFPDDILVEIGRKIRILCDEFGATFIIDSRFDIARIVEADGVHLGTSCVNISDAREVLGGTAIIGKDILSADDAVEAFNEGYDYINIGPLYVGLNKINPELNIDDIDWINKNIDIPLFVFGNINLDNINGAVQAGANKIALTEAVMYAQIPEETARKILNLLP